MEGEEPPGGEVVGAEVIGAGAAVGLVEMAGCGRGEMVRVDGLVDGASDPQAADAMARTMARAAVNGRSGTRGIPVGRSGRVAGSGPPRFGAARNSAVHGWIRLIRVAQLASAVRVPPQLPNGVASYWAKVHVCPMYSAATQMFVPSTAVAP